MTRLDRQNALAAALGALGWTPVPEPPAPRVPGLPEPASSWVLRAYRDLGGIQTHPRLRPSGWDIALADGLIVELDEEQHFNRYRAGTLQASWASALPWRSAYLEYCRRHEGAALCNNSGIGFWQSAGSVAQFGPAGPRRELDGAGSPRWRQRALYDAMRDVVAATGTVRLARLSVHDVVAGARLGDLLGGRGTLDPAALGALVAERTFPAAASPAAAPAGNREPAVRPGRGDARPGEDAPIEVAALARRLDRSPKTLRHALRLRYGTLPEGGRWLLTSDQVAYLETRFAESRGSRREM